MISQRTKAAFAQTKARGTKLGNPEPLKALALANAATAHLTTAPEIRELVTRWLGEGKTFRTIVDNLNRLSIRTPHGSQWYACSVRNLLATATARKAQKTEACASSANGADGRIFGAGLSQGRQLPTRRC